MREMDFAFSKFSCQSSSTHDYVVDELVLFRNLSVIADDYVILNVRVKICGDLLE